MRRPFFPILAIVFCLVCLPAWGEKTRQISWRDLVPTDLLSSDPLAELTEEQREQVFWLSDVGDELLKSGQEEVEKDLIEEIEKTIKNLNDSGIDVQLLVAKLTDVRTAIVKELDGKSVRIPGYLLPLEVSGSKVTEFLLVPYVGACIHVPPPPRNQIVYVKSPPGKGYTSEDLFDPVWVSGVISAQPLVKDLYLIDGPADINIGYSMQATRVEPYKSSEKGMD